MFDGDNYGNINISSKMFEEPEKKNRRNNKILIIVVIILSLLIVAAGIFIFIKFNDNSSEGKKVEPEEVTVSKEEITYDNYLYKIRHDYVNESYIYLFDDKTIKVVSKKPVYENCDGDKCSNFTGEYTYEVTKVDVSADEFKKIKKQIDTIAVGMDGKEFNTKELVYFSEADKRLLTGIVLNDRMRMLTEETLFIKSERDLTRGESGRKLIYAKYTLEPTIDSKAAKAMADRMNGTVEEDYKEYYANKDTEIKKLKANQSATVEFKIEMAYAGAESLSFVYTVSDKVNNRENIKLITYNFKYSGDTYELDSNTLDSYVEDAITIARDGGIINVEGIYLDEKTGVQVQEATLRSALKKEGAWYFTSDGYIHIITSFRTCGIDTNGYIDLTAPIKEEK